MPCATPLALTRHAVMVPVHGRARAMIKEICCLGAGCHLRASCAAVAAEQLDGCSRRSNFRGRLAMRRWRDVLPGNVCKGGHRRQKQCTQDADQLIPATSARHVRCLRLRSPRPLLRAGTQDADGLWLAVLADVYLVRHQFADTWSNAVAGKRRDVHEDLRASRCGFDKAESAIVVPLGQRAVSPHGLVLDSVLEVVLPRCKWWFEIVAMSTPQVRCALIERFLWCGP